MLFSVFAFELRYALRQPAFWIISAAYFLFAFIYISSSVAGSALATTAVNVNSPWAITRMVIQLSYIGLLGSAAFVGSSIIRDFNTGISSILFTTQLVKPAYVFGRFLGGVAAALAAFSFVFLGLALGAFAPWADPRMLGPFPGAALATAFFVFAAPNVLIGSAALFAAALLTKDTVKTYVAAVAILIAFFISRAFAGAFYATDDAAMIASLAEPFGAYAATLTILDWSAFERNTQLIAFQDLIGWNRLVWVSIAGALLTVAYFRFRMQADGVSGGGKPAKSQASNARTRAADARAVDQAARTPSLFETLLRLIAFETGRVVKSAPFVIITVLSCAGLWFWVTMYGRAFGTGFYPYTGDMAAHLQTVFEVPLMAVIIFYAADLVWSARDRKIHEIMDAAPTSDSVFFLSKLAALWAAIAVVLAAGVVTAIAFQLSRGFFEIDAGVYAVRVLAMSAPYFFIMATIALALQALLGGRFAAMLAMIAVYVGTLVANQAGLFNNLLIPGARLEAHYNPLAGYGHYLAPAVWFRLYWLALAGLIASLAAGAWVRGSQTNLKSRFGRMIGRLSGGYGRAAAGFALAGLVSGGFIGWNTMGLNEVESPRRSDRLAAQYERLYVDWRDRSQPELETVSGRLDLYPQTRHFELSLSYGLVNQTDESIEEVLLVAPPGADLRSVRASAPGSVDHDREHGAAIIRLEEALAPETALDLELEVASAPIRGFTNRPQRTPVAYDASLIFYDEFLPTVGYSRARELGDERAREDLGLPEQRSGVRAEGDPRGLAEQEGQTFADWVDIDLTVGTVADQTPIAQGARVSEWREQDRRYARFVSGPPVKLHMGVVSGGYETAERVHQGVAGPIRIAVSHFPTHGRNAERLLDTLQETLAVLEAHFGPYPYEDMRLVEAAMGRPNCRIRSDTLICDSSLGFINDPRLDDPRTPPSILVRVPASMLANLYVQSMIMPANQPGATSIADGLGFYLSGLVWRDMVTERAAAESVRDAAWHYFTHRATEDDGEDTIVDHVNQTYVGAHKNAVSMYGLDYYLGSESMIEAIAGFIEDRRFEQPPFAQESDLVRAFRTVAPDAVQPIITDFFERRTLFDIAASSATRRPAPEGGFELEVEVRARKMYAQRDGEMREAEFDYPVEFVVFGERDRATGAREIIHREQVSPERLSSGRIRVVVDQEPEEVGLDPFFRLLDRNYLDNRTDVGG